MTIDKYNFAGKKAIVRVDFNVPLDENGKITDDTRIRGALPTLKKILADGGSLIIMSHMGMRYEQLIPWFNPGEGAFRVILGDYVTTEDGTGIVHIAAAHWPCSDACTAR